MDGQKLLQAVINNDIDVVRALLERGTDPNYLAPMTNECWKYRKEDYGTPLHVATEQDNVELVRVLLHYGANPNNTGHTNQIPLVIATWHKNFDIIEIFLNHGIHINHINSLSCLAVQSLDPDIIQIFIKSGLDLRTISLDDFLGQYEYTGIDNFELLFIIIELLLQHGVDWNNRGYNTKTPKDYLIYLQQKFGQTPTHNYQKLIDLIQSYDDMPTVKGAM